MSDVLEDLKAERKDLDAELEAISGRASAEVRKLTEAEDLQAKDLLGRIGIVDERLKMHIEQMEARHKNETLVARASGFGNRAVERRDSYPTETAAWGRGPIAQAAQGFVESDQFRGYNGVGSSGRYEIEGYLEQRAAITTANLSIPHFVIAPIEVTFRSALLEVVGRVTVSAGVVDWVEVGGDPVAAVVAEGSAKPEAAIVMTPKTAALDTLAHWIQITRQALDDAPYIRSLIEGKLRRGLFAKAETDMATAIDAATTATATGADLSKSIRVGIGKVEGAGYNPNAVVLNPADYATLDITAAADGHTGPDRRSTFWGLTAVPAASVAAGKAYVGDFASGATLFDRGVTNVFLSDSHASLFISNILVILAEARVKSAVTEPLAICECTVV